MSGTKEVQGAASQQPDRLEPRQTANDRVPAQLIATVEDLLFWIAQGDFSAMPIAAIEAMNKAKADARAALAEAQGQLAALSQSQGRALFRRDDEDPEAYAAMVRMAGRENDALLAAEKIRTAAQNFLRVRDAIPLVGDDDGLDAWSRRVAVAVEALRTACEEASDAPR